LSRLDAALEYLSEHPPTYQLLAAFVGYERPVPMTLEEFAGVIGIFGGRVERGH
jgi:hypothetical protein